MGLKESNQHAFSRVKIIMWLLHPKSQNKNQKLLRKGPITIYDRTNPIYSFVFLPWETKSESRTLRKIKIETSNSAPDSVRTAVIYGLHFTEYGRN